MIKERGSADFHSQKCGEFSVQFLLILKRTFEPVSVYEPGNKHNDVLNNPLTAHL